MFSTGFYVLRYKKHIMTSMYYVEVLVADATYHGNEALTYSSADPLEKGSIVVVPLRAKQVLGVVVAIARKPSFVTKPVHEVPSIPSLPTQAIELLGWLREYYPSPLGSATQLFLPKQLPKKPYLEKPIKTPPAALPPLTLTQQKILGEVTDPGMYLLHGETGSGKTRVYIELAKRALQQGKSVIILTPEIGLTSQLGRDFRATFGARVKVIHSRLTDATRQRLWLALLEETEPSIVIGARSALFSPIRNIGLIVVDEAHETAYKQDQAPHYHASRVASKLAQLHGASVILGSATPLVGDYYLAEAKKRPILRMAETARPGASTYEHSVEVIDLRDRKAFSKNNHLSDALLTAITETLAKHEQVLLFLNRRGTARVVFCERCGWQATCPHCDVPLVYHGDSHLVRCHSCDYKTTSPSSCPECHHASIVFKTVGTKAITEEITRLFPEATVQRFDTDNAKAERIEEHYAAVHRGDVDIIVGTQMLAKGLDLPKLGLVGVIIADTSLYVPDFSSQERTFQLLSQVLGRVGRGHRATKAILQTYAPDSPILEAILTKDWSSFYNKEMEERKLFLFPPFCYLLKLTCRRASPAAAQKAAQDFATKLQTSGLRIIVEGPAPSFHEKFQNKFQWQLIAKAKDRHELLKVIAQLPSNWSYDIDPMNLL
jgi:primosomal protein N' (replication factor Y)